MNPFFAVIAFGLFLGGMQFGSWLNSDAHLLKLARDQNLLIEQLSGTIPKIVEMPPFGTTAMWADVINVKLQPMTIKLRFVDRAEFDRLRDGRNAAAFSRPTLNPCEIVIPADGRIVAKPDAASYSAHWDWGDDMNVGMILAHEILHCSHGDWHPEGARRDRPRINELGYEIEPPMTAISTELKR